MKGNDRRTIRYPKCDQCGGQLFRRHGAFCARTMHGTKDCETDDSPTS